MSCWGASLTGCSAGVASGGPRRRHCRRARQRFLLIRRRGLGMSEAEPGTSPNHGDEVPPRLDALHRKVEAIPVEARAFQGQRAGVVTRTAANVVDFLLGSGVLLFGYASWCVLKFLLNPTRFTFPAPSWIALLICMGAVLFAYFTVSWATTGRNYGDHQLGLRVVSPHGERLGWLVAVVRAAICVLLPIGLYWAILSSTNRSVQDSVLRTSVVYDWTVRRQPPARITRSG